MACVMAKERMIQCRTLSIKSNEMIGNIRERDLRGVDLNLLVTLLVLLRERSVSKAAACLYLGQPAVSGALARLRLLFHDDLLVRTPSGMRPTARGIELQSQLLPLISHMQAVVLQQPTFDAATSERRFIIGVMDWVNDWLLPGLLARLAVDAPGVSLAVLATDRYRYTELLQQEEVDLVVGPFSDGPRWQRNEPIALVPYSCVARPGVFGEHGKLGMKRFAALPHVMVTYRGATQGIVDDALASRGLRRKVVCTVPAFSSVPAALRQIAAVATVPRVLAESWRDDFGLEVAQVPVALPENQLAIVTHQSRGSDPAVQWLSGIVKALALPRA